MRTELLWLEEHFLSYKKCRDSDPATAVQEFRYLESSVRDARSTFAKLADMLSPSESSSPSD